ncbi:MAG: hypothetical protein ACQES9_01735 [Myxococcota bacterium]
MEFICANCGKEFESRETTPRCPSCLRKHTVMASENRNSPKLGLNLKVMILAITGLLSLIVISIVLYRQLQQNSTKTNAMNRVKEEQINEILKNHNFQDLEKQLQLTPFQV